MVRFVLAGLLARRQRSVLTALAVLVGVAMISGTFIFTDTIDRAFRQLFSEASRGADVIVSGRQDITSAANAPAEIPGSLVDKIRRLPGVRVADGQISDVASIVGRDGKVIKSQGAPTLALSYTPPPFSGISFLAGGPPAGPDQVAIDQQTAARQHFRIGDRVQIVTGEPARRFRVAGIASLGDTSLGGATFAVFDLATARQLYAKQGKLDIVYVAGQTGVTTRTLVGEIEPLLSPELVARTTGGQVDTNVNRVSARLGILTGGLLAFGLIAVLVGAFVIFNTFSITVTQRIGEFALLRALGATRAQILGAVLAEAAAVGALASLAGLAAGTAAARALRALFSGAGFDLPTTRLVLEPRTVIVSLALGVLVTVLAGLQPALRATRVAPLEALRESTVPAVQNELRVRLLALIRIALALVGLIAIFTSSGSAGAQVRQSAIGALLLVLAIVLSSPLAIGRLAAIAAWPIARGGRIIGTLARENAGRNPTRTAVSASSLMIGLALVLFVTVYASGLRSSTSRIIHQSFLGDFTIENEDGVSPIPAAAARTTAEVPGVLAVSSLKTAEAQLPGAGKLTAEGIDPNTVGQVYKFEWDNGSPATLAGLGPGDAIVERDTANSAHLKVGDRVRLTTETGAGLPFTVRGIYTDRALLRGVALPLFDFDRVFHQSRLQAVFVKLGPGADRSIAAAALNQALRAYPGVVARSERQLEHEVAGRVNSILVLFYALLAMSVLMALLGIVNTLNLSIYERTRELGLMRAVGMTSRQARELIRDESVVTAAIGTLVGVALGIFLAWVITRALASEDIVFSLPWGEVAIVLAGGLASGVLAAIPAARRAARVDLLEAIAHE